MICNNIQVVSADSVPLMYSQSMVFLSDNLPSPQMKSLIPRLFQNPNNSKRTLTCLDGEEIIGVSVGGQLNDQRSYLEFMLVLPEYRGAGVGKFLLNNFEQRELAKNISAIEADTYDPRVTEWMVRQGYKIFRRDGVVANHIKYF